MAHDLFCVPTITSAAGHSLAMGSMQGKCLDEDILLERLAAKWGLRGTNGQRITVQPCGSQSHADLNGE